MNKYFKQHADYSESVMETGDHFKNGASPKSQRNRGIVRKCILYLLVISSICIMQSCAVATLRARHASLSEGYSCSVIGLQWQQELIQKEGNISSQKPYNWYLFYGLGFLNFDDKDEERYLSGLSSPKIGANFGLGANYLLLKGRTQPYIGLDYDSFFHSKNKINVMYMSIVPHVGLRYFISPFTAITGNAGYSISSVNMTTPDTDHDRKDKYYNIKGITYSIGLSYVF
jgi:hypothetical protein